MSNKTQLQTNNTNLDALIARVNAAKITVASLPEAGGGEPGGGSLETVTITLSDHLMEPGSMVYYLDSTFSLQSAYLVANMSFTTIKNSILVTTDLTTGHTLPSCTRLVGNSMCSAYLVTG